MNYNLFLDDIRDPRMAYDTCIRDPRYLMLGWVIVRNFEEFITKIMDDGVPDLVSFDHDLADIHYSNYFSGSWENKYYEKNEEKTGYQCLKWLCDYCIEHKELIPECIFHTANTVGKENMKNYYMNFLKNYKESK